MTWASFFQKNPLYHSQPLFFVTKMQNFTQRKSPKELGAMQNVNMHDICIYLLLPTSKQALTPVRSKPLKIYPLSNVY
jgi:hypothetical protein